MRESTPTAVTILRGDLEVRPVLEVRYDEPLADASSKKLCVTMQECGMQRNHQNFVHKMQSSPLFK